MNCFQYPLDVKSLLRNKGSIKKELMRSNCEWIYKKIAILGGSTTNEITVQLELFLLYYGIKADFYESDYGQYWQDAVFGNSDLEEFKPDLIYIHTSWRNIRQFPTVINTKEEVEDLVETEYRHFKEMWDALEHRMHCPIIQNNFDRPNYRLMGNRDIWDFRGRSNYISRLNQKFYSYAQIHDNFYINDLEFIAQDFGLTEWGNSRYWYMYKYAMCFNAIPYIADSIAKIIKSIFGKNKKVLALDLDNTLWGGIVGDDGVEGIQIGQEVSKGQAFYEFQKYLKNLQQIGVVLTVNSKNDVENALAGLNHPNGVLKPNDFVQIKANWNPKDQNLIEMANDLSLGIESFVFVDDNPAERELVSARIPEIEVPKMDRVENYICILDHGGFFETTVLSEEDIDKTKKYRAKTEARQQMALFENYEEYLKSLRMKAVIDDFKPIYIQRIAQLTNKTNQFNLTTLRCSEDDIMEMQRNDKYLCLCARLFDKFGDHGLVVVVVGEYIGIELHIRLFLMSCRVLKRGLEDMIMNVIANMAEKKAIKKMIGYYYPTAKNSMVKKFYSNMGFQKKSEDARGNTVWEIELGKYVSKKIFISDSE